MSHENCDIAEDM